MDKKKEMTLYVPNNIRTNTELFDGFGFKELAITGAVTSIFIVAAFIIYGITNEVYHGMFLVLISIATTVMAVRKNDINQSIINMICVFFEYGKKQQSYKYAYTDPFKLPKNADYKGFIN